MSKIPAGIILDLDETLLHTADDNEESSYHKLGLFSDPRMIPYRDRVYHFNLSDVKQRGQRGSDFYWGFKRPYVEEFLQFCNDHFQEVIIWTAGIASYADEIVGSLFVDLPLPRLVLSREDCAKFGEEALLHKPLNKVVTRLNNLPGNTTVWGLHNLISVDDRETTWMDNPQNGVLIPAYTPAPDIVGLRSDDVSLLKLQNWIKKMLLPNSWSDIRSLEKKNIFS